MYRKYILIVVAITATVLAACVPAAASPQPPAHEITPGDEVQGYVEFLEALRAQGATVEPQDEIDQPFFQVDGRLIQVDGAEIQVFEFSDQSTREQASSLISQDGTSIGPTVVTWVAQPNFWARGNLIVLYLGQDQEIIGLLTNVLGDPLTEHTISKEKQTPSESDELPDAVQAAVQRLAKTQDVEPQAIEVIDFEPVNWPNSCLGLAEPGEMCLQVITPGWKVILSVQGKQYELHTDEDGSSVRLQQFSLSGPSSSQPAVQAAKNALGAKLGLKVNQIEVISVEQVDWSNACLELAGADEMCAMVITPGYRVILQAQGQEYEIHTDLAGDQVRLK